MKKTLAVATALAATIGWGSTAVAQNINPNYSNLTEYVQAFQDDPSLLVVSAQQPAQARVIFFNNNENVYGGDGTGLIWVVERGDHSFDGGVVNTTEVAGASANYANSRTGTYSNNTVATSFVYVDTFHGGRDKNSLYVLANPQTNTVQELDLTLLGNDLVDYNGTSPQEFELLLPRGNRVSAPANNSSNLVDVDILPDTVLPMPNFIPNVLGNLDDNPNISAALTVVGLGANTVPVGGGSAGYTPLYRFTEFDGKGPGSY